MKINETQRIRVQPIHPVREITKKEVQMDTDQLSISLEAKELLENEANRAERIELLKQQIENGTYEVEPDQLADKLFKFRQDWM